MVGAIAAIAFRFSVRADLRCVGRRLAIIPAGRGRGRRRWLGALCASMRIE